jgi:hypothetical protein
MSVQRICSTARISFQTKPDRNVLNPSRHSQQAGGLENNGNQDASSDTDEHGSHSGHHDSDDGAIHHSSDCLEITDPAALNQDGFERLLERLKNAHRLDLHF